MILRELRGDKRVPDSAQHQTQRVTPHLARLTTESFPGMKPMRPCKSEGRNEQFRQIRTCLHWSTVAGHVEISRKTILPKRVYIGLKRGLSGRDERHIVNGAHQRVHDDWPERQFEKNAQVGCNAIQVSLRLKPWQCSAHAMARINNVLLGHCNRRNTHKLT